MNAPFNMIPRVEPEAGPHTAPVTRLGGIPIAALDMHETVDLMVSAVLSRPRPGRPLYFTSANGEVISRHAKSPDFARLLATADLVSADGQPMVLLSRIVGDLPLPERVATTDLFHVAAQAAIANGLTFYMYGATEEENRKATENALRLHPGLRIVGRAHGYRKGEELRRTLAEIDALAPDILWLALGVPREQIFVEEYGSLLQNVGLIKTSGGLFNFLSGTRRRAPAIVQDLGMEWLWRLGQEPRRLFWRYAVTNPHAAYLLLRGRPRARSTGRLLGGGAAEQPFPPSARSATGPDIRGTGR